MPICKISYYYHLSISILSVLAGYLITGYAFYTDFDASTLAAKIFMTFVFLAFGTVCFLLFPMCFLAFSAIRFFTFIPLIFGNYSALSFFGFFWAIFNVYTIFLAVKYKNENENLPSIFDMIYKSKLFPESALAHQLLDGLTGLEIGGSAHNAFGLDTLNVDALSHEDPHFMAVYGNEQIRLCGEVMPVDIVAPGDKIPVPNNSFDFVISSHVIEHFYDPIGAIKEWVRIARKYVYIICPQPDALESDRTKLITGLQELIERHTRKDKPDWTDEHHTRWTCDTFRDMCAAYGWHVSHWQDPDDKVGNGFAVVIDVRYVIGTGDQPLTGVIKAVTQGTLKTVNK